VIVTDSRSPFVACGSSVSRAPRFSRFFSII
jgi:hypothetical protein